jgi:hypothetical protein
MIELISSRTQNPIENGTTPGTENIFTAETVLWGFLVQRECELCASAMFLIMLRPLRLTGPTPVLHRGDTQY